MPIQVTCGKCSNSFVAPDRFAGRRGACPSCGMLLAVPGAPVTASPPQQTPPALPAAVADDDKPLIVEAAAIAVVRGTVSAVKQTGLAIRTLPGAILGAGKSATARRTESPSPLVNELDGGRQELNRAEQAWTPPAVVPESRAIQGGLKDCPFCAEPIQAAAVKCKHCGEIVDVRMRAMDESRKQAAQQAAPVYVNVSQNVNVGDQYRRGISFVAAFLSFFIPGLGQIYRGRLFAGILWFVFVAAGYAAFIIPGVILHFVCVLSAFFG